MISHVHMSFRFNKAVLYSGNADLGIASIQGLADKFISGKRYASKNMEVTTLAAASASQEFFEDKIVRTVWSEYNAMYVLSQTPERQHRIWIVIVTSNPKDYKKPVGYFPISGEKTIFKQQRSSAKGTWDHMVLDVYSESCNPRFISCPGYFLSKVSATDDPQTLTWRKRAEERLESFQELGEVKVNDLLFTNKYLTFADGRDINVFRVLSVEDFNAIKVESLVDPSRYSIPSSALAESGFKVLSPSNKEEVKQIIEKTIYPDIRNALMFIILRKDIKYGITALKSAKDASYKYVILKGLIRWHRPYMINNLSVISRYLSKEEFLWADRELKVITIEIDN